MIVCIEKSPKNHFHPRWASCSFERGASNLHGFPAILRFMPLAGVTLFEEEHLRRRFSWFVVIFNGPHILEDPIGMFLKMRSDWTKAFLFFLLKLLKDMMQWSHTVFVSFWVLMGCVVVMR